MCKFEKSPYTGFTKGDLNTFVNKSEDEITWVTADRKVLKLSEISDSHLSNLIDWLKDKNPRATYLNRVFGEWTIIFVDEHNKRILRKDAERAYNEELYRLNKEVKFLTSEKSRLEKLRTNLNNEAAKVRSTAEKLTKKAEELEQFKRDWGF